MLHSFNIRPHIQHACCQTFSAARTTYNIHYDSKQSARLRVADALTINPQSTEAYRQREYVSMCFQCSVSELALRSTQFIIFKLCEQIHGVVSEGLTNLLDTKIIYYNPSIDIIPNRLYITTITKDLHRS